MARLRGPLLLALLAALADARPAAANSNKLLNPGFDGSTADWLTYSVQNFTTTYAPSFGHWGAGSLLVAPSGTAAIYSVVATQPVNVKPGVTYSFGTYFWYSADSATTPQAQVEVRWYSDLGGAGTHIETYVSPLTPTDSAATWMLTLMSLEAPANAKSARFDLVLKTTESKTALAVFDDPFVGGGVIGDMDGDGAVDVADVFFLVNFLFSNGPLPIGPADVNQDYVVDVSDAFYLINYLFGGGDPPVE